MAQRFLTALPVYNEAKYVSGVLAEVRRYSPEILVVNDGSSDGTTELLAAEPGVHLVTHEKNRGYGAALRSAFDFAVENNYDVLVTIDCDGQHQPRMIPQFFAECADWDIVSGSRYLEQFAGDSQPPADRRRVNELLTARINELLGLNITDAFCGFKSYRVCRLPELHLTDDGYAMPLELWVQAAFQGFRIKELAVPLIYLDLARSFGGALDDTETRLAHYNKILQAAMARTTEHRKTTPHSRSLCNERAG